MPRIAHWVWFPFGVTIRFIGRNGKRIAVTVFGFVLLLAGLAMMVLPGPGVLVIIAGLAVLAAEYVWALIIVTLNRNNNTKATVLSIGLPTLPADPDVD